MTSKIFLGWTQVSYIAELLVAGLCPKSSHLLKKPFFEGQGIKISYRLRYIQGFLPHEFHSWRSMKQARSFAYDAERPKLPNSKVTWKLIFLTSLHSWGSFVLNYKPLRGMDHHEKFLLTQTSTGLLVQTDEHLFGSLKHKWRSTLNLWVLQSVILQ